MTGKLNPNEAASDALKREILEETGLNCRSFYNIDATLFYDRSKDKVAISANFCAFAKHTDPVFLSSREHDAYRWVPFAEAYSLLAFPAQKETLFFIHKHFVLQTPHAVNLLC